MPEPVVRLESVTKRYGDDPDAGAALADVSLSVLAGEFVGIMGQSGSGKTTLLNLVGGLDRAYTGSVTVLGKELSKLGDRALSELRNDSIGFVFQSYHLMPQLTCAENVALPALFRRRPVPDLPDRVARVLDRVGLATKARERPGSLSGGQKQRVAIARAMLLDPKLLLCDEPTGNLDRETGEAIVAAVRKLSSSAGLTVVIVTHEEHVGSACDRIVTLRDGRIPDEDDGGIGAPADEGPSGEEPS